MEGKFRGQPRTEAAIRLTIGKAYWALGRYPEGQRQLERSVELYAAELGADHPVTLTSKSSLAYLYGAQGRYDRAEPLAEEVVRARTARLGAHHPDTLTSKNNLAQVYRAQKKYAQAEPLYLEVVRADTATLGADHNETLRAKTNLARSLPEPGAVRPRGAALRRGRAGGDAEDRAPTIPTPSSARTASAAVYMGEGRHRRGRGACSGKWWRPGRPSSAPTIPTR